MAFQYSIIACKTDTATGDVAPTPLHLGFGACGKHAADYQGMEASDHEVSYVFGGRELLFR